ncbi:acetyltransferase, partial [Staphylococcus sp. 231237_7MaSpsaltlick]
MKSIMIIGNGGHAKVIKDIISRNNSLTFKGYLDDNIKEFYERDGLIYDCLD